MSWHLNAVCGLFDAVHGSLAFVAYRTLVAPDAQAIRPVFHIATVLIALGLRLWFARRYRVPFGFLREDRRAIRSLAA